MNGLTHLRTIQSAAGQLVALVAVDNRGSVFYGHVIYDDKDGQPGRVVWKPLQESQH